MPVVTVTGQGTTQIIYDIYYYYSTWHMLYVHNMQPCIFFVLHRYLHTHTHTFAQLLTCTAIWNIFLTPWKAKQRSNYFNYTSLVFSVEAWRKNELEKFSTNYYINKFSFKNKHAKNKESWRLGGFCYFNLQGMLTLFMSITGGLDWEVSWLQSLMKQHRGGGFFCW